MTVWGSTVLAAAAGPEGDAWFSAYLGRPVRLVYLDDPTRRAVDPQFGRPGDVVSFADGFPLLLTSTASLDELGRWLAEEGEPPVPMTRSGHRGGDRGPGRGPRNRLSRRCPADQGPGQVIDDDLDPRRPLRPSPAG